MFYMILKKFQKAELSQTRKMKVTINLLKKNKELIYFLKYYANLFNSTFTIFLLRILFVHNFPLDTL